MDVLVWQQLSQNLPDPFLQDVGTTSLACSAATPPPSHISEPSRYAVVTFLLGPPVAERGQLAGQQCSQAVSHGAASRVCNSMLCLTVTETLLRKIRDCNNVQSDRGSLENLHRSHFCISLIIHYHVYGESHLKIKFFFFFKVTRKFRFSRTCRTTWFYSHESTSTPLSGSLFPF